VRGHRLVNYELAAAYTSTLATLDTVIDWRAIHDTDKGVPGHSRRGTLAEMWSWLCDMNGQGYGIFCNINQMDGIGRHLENVASVRAHVVDLDNSSAAVNFDRASQFQPAPQFSVNSSPGKYHVYWLVNLYSGNDRCTAIQRKLRQLFDGDKACVDASRVMRVPGFYHRKGEPFMVTCATMAG